jgi:hypothetical protein
MNLGKETQNRFSNALTIPPLSVVRTVSFDRSDSFDSSDDTSNNKVQLNFISPSISMAKSKSETKRTPIRKESKAKAPYEYIRRCNGNCVKQTFCMHHPALIRAILAIEKRRLQDKLISITKSKSSCQQGTGIIMRPGNVRFHNLLKKYQITYLGTDCKAERSNIIKNIISQAQSKEGGRFAKLDSKCETWIQIPSDEAEEKIAEVLNRNIM